MRRRATRVHLAAGLLGASLLGVGCASSSGPDGDPLRPVNRPIFSFNQAVDDYALGPVARGWEWVSPEVVRDGVSNFFYNAAFPSRFVSEVGQAEAEMAAQELGRFLLNTTVGVAGFVDVASRIGVPRHEEDVGQMFGRWGVPAGPYWVLPLLGPSSPRDTVGMVADTALNPLAWLAPGSGAVYAVNARAQADDRIESAKRAALDFYVFVRDAYTQYRAALVRNATRPGEPEGGYDYLAPVVQDEDLYEIQDDDEAS